MIFNSKHIQASLTSLTSSFGQSHSIPSDGKILVHSGETIHGFAQVDDPHKLESMTIEFAAYQNVAVEAMESSLPSAGEMTMSGLAGTQAQIGLIKATNKPVLWRSATELFRQIRVVQKDELSGGGEAGKVGWEFRMPEVDKKGDGLPPSVQLPHSRSAGGSVGYNRYQVTVTIERKGSLGRTKSETIILPIFYLPYNPSHSPPSISPLTTFLSTTNPDTVPPVPEKWKTEVAKTTWDLVPKKNLFSNNSSSSNPGAGGQIRAQFAYPHLDDWPSGEYIPYHLLIIFSSPSQPPALNLTACETTFNLTQRISCNVRRKRVAQRAEEKVLPGQKVGGVGFECTKEGVWAGDEKDEVGWSKVLVVMGRMKVTGLPTFFTDVMSLVYAINLTITLPSDSPFTTKKQTILLGQPPVGSPLYPSNNNFNQPTDRAAQTAMASEMVGKYYHADEEDFQWVRGEGSGSRGPFEEPWKKLGSDMT